ncbi:hypothetical protein ATCCBAA256_09430 [Mycobacterium montefiorense]|nr:hypothetical protein ATCCBAA256_09430 [Mycobacterium montefiorense]
MLLIQRGDQQFAGVVTVRVQNPRVQFEPLDSFDDPGRAQIGLQLYPHQRVRSAKRICQQRNGSGGVGDHPQAQLADEAGLQCRDFQLEGVAVGQDPPRPVHQPFALGRQTFEFLAAPDQRDLQLVFELADCFRQRRLGYMTGIRRVREMPLPGQRDEVLQLTKQHES